jgi:TonB family protein
MAVALIFFAPHPLPAPPPTAYTVELGDPNALGGKLLAGPIGGENAKPPPKAPPPPPPPPEPPPPPPPPPPDQLAKAEEPPPPVADDEHDDEAIALGTPVATPVATATRRPTQQPTARPTANPTAKPTPRPSATVAPSKPKATATPAVVVAKKGTPVPVEPSRRPEHVAATPGAEAKPKPGPTAAPADDLDGKLAEAIKGVEAKVEKSGKSGVGGAAGPGGGMGGTERQLDGPAGIGGEGPGGGGTVRGLEFVVYYNQMLNRIKERWAWVGTRTDLRVSVHFSILPSGEITNIRLVERSGDQSYDGSVERAVKGAGPLPPPPEAYRTDFADVELTFRPADLQR